MDPSLLQPGIFLHPRPKKNVLSSQPNKRRKIEHKIEEISFDNDARADYLTGFHKRKVQRAKRAQEEAVKKGREERVEMRKQVCAISVFFLFLSIRCDFLFYFISLGVDCCRIGGSRGLGMGIE